MGDAGTSRRSWAYPEVVLLAEWFTERSARGLLSRAAGAWVLVGLPVIAARIWWSVPAALVVFAVSLTVYVTVAVRFMGRHRPPGK